jgi:hypothetical protein
MTTCDDARDAERRRLAEADEGVAPWKRWGPCPSERQWGTVREDYSADRDAWSYLTHYQACARAYRWGEGGMAGVSDDRQRLHFALCEYFHGDNGAGLGTSHQTGRTGRSRPPRRCSTSSAPTTGTAAAMSACGPRTTGRNPRHDGDPRDQHPCLAGRAERAPRAPHHPGRGARRGLGRDRPARHRHRLADGRLAAQPRRPGDRPARRIPAGVVPRGPPPTSPRRTSPDPRTAYGTTSSTPPSAGRKAWPPPAPNWPHADCG